MVVTLLVAAGTLAVLILFGEGFKLLGIDFGAAGMILGELHFYFLSYGVTPLMAGYACWAAYSYRVGLRWPLGTALLLAVVGGMLLTANVTFNPGTGPGPHGSYMIGFGFALDHMIRSIWRLVAPLAVFFAFALWARTKGQDLIGYRMEL